MEDFNFSNQIPRREQLDPGKITDTLTKRVLGLDWNLHLPVSFTKESETTFREFSIVPCTYTDGKDFLEDNAQILFSDSNYNHSFMMLDDCPNKDSYYNNCVDNFAILCEQKMVGYASINMQDWSTYYLRYINVLPKYRGDKIVVDVVNTVEKTLSAYGVSRIQADVAVNNPSQLSKMVRMGFVVTGNTQCERWGSMVSLTKLLNEKARDVFSKQYCIST